MSRYIDEDRLYSNIEEKYKVAQGDARKAYNDVLDTICEIPAADVQEVRHGEWIFRGDYTSMCSCCNNDVEVDHEKEPKYCPECGAKMDAGE